MKTPSLASVVASVVLFQLLTPIGAQATIQVPTQQPSIQAAIAAASNGDTIVVAPGTHFETNIDFLGKAVTVMSSGGATVTIIDPQSMGRAFLFISGETSTSILDGFTIRNGRSADGTLVGTTAGASGGAVIGIASSPIIRNCVFSTNRAGNGVLDSNAPPITPLANGGDGGAIAFSGGAPLIEDCTFLSNVAGDGGGNGDDPAGNGGRGGAIALLASNATISGCTFTMNRGGGGNTGFDVGGSGGNGGAIFAMGGSVTIEDCTCTANSGGLSGFGNDAAGASGGGGACRFDSSIVLVRRSRFVSNEAGDGGFGAFGGFGGAVSVALGSLIIEDSEFDENLAGDGGVRGLSIVNGGGGGAVDIRSAPTVIRRSKFLMNRAGNGQVSVLSSGRGGDGGALFIALMTGSTTMTSIEDCVFDGNRSGIAPLPSTMTPAASGGSGGAIASSLPLTIRRSAFLGNTTGASSTATFNGGIDFPLGGRGGAIFTTSSLLVEGSTFIGNATGSSASGLPPLAGSRGGAISAQGPSLTVVSSTFVDNVCGTFNGVPAAGSAIASAAPIYVISHTIIRGGSIPRLNGLPIIDHSNIQGGMIGGAGNIDIPPLFVNPMRGNYRLATGSPGIDGGDASSPLLGMSDFDGEPRIDGSAPDIGADEYHRMGTADDLELTMHVDGAGNGYGADLAPANASLIDALVRSPGGTFDSSPIVIATRLFANGTGPMAPPAIPFAHIGVTPGFSILIDPLLLPGGNAYALPTPTGLGGTSSRVQMFGLSPSATNGLIAATAAFDIVWP